MATSAVSKFFFIISAVMIVIIVSFGAGMYSYRESNAVFRLVRTVMTQVEEVASSGGLEGVLGQVHSEHLQPSRGQGDGVTINSRPLDSSLIFMMGFFDDENQARLIRRDGSIVNKWSLDYFSHFPNKNRRVCNFSKGLRIDTHGAVLKKNGELVFNYEYCGTVKLSPCGEVVWTLDQKTHHSVTSAERGGYWIIGRETETAPFENVQFLPYTSLPLLEKIDADLILLVSEEGEILERISIVEALYKSGMEAVISGTGSTFTSISETSSEIIHANKIEELSAEISSAFPMFNAGDLAISMRHRNLIVILDGSSKRVKWFSIGPWLRQHDPEFRSDGKISVFNNNVYLTSYDKNGYSVLDAPRVTNILAIDPRNAETEIVYGSRPGQEMLSVIRGQHELLEDNEMIVTEFDAGRVFQVDGSGQIIWEFVNKYDENFVGEITDSHLFSAEYLDFDFSKCDK